MPFQVKGEQPEWRMVYDALPRAFDSVITYDQLGKILGRDFRTNRGPIYRANAELLEMDQRALAPVRNVGYRVVQPAEHEDLAKRDHKSARRKLRKAVAEVSHVDKKDLPADVRARIEGLELAYRRHEQILRRLDDRTKRTEKAVAVHDQQMTDLQGQVDRLQTQLQQRGLLPEVKEAGAA
jgi:chaperonin cofactor prefoldin